MRAVSLHPDVVVVTSAIWQTTCTLVRGGETGSEARELFVIDSPLLPDELDALPAVCERMGAAGADGLLVTHGDWDHLLTGLAFPDAALGCAESTAARLTAEPGAAARGLREFDDEHYVTRPTTLRLAGFQALPVPGRCEVGASELALHPASGHAVDGMAIWIGWAGVLVVGDYLSSVEIPTIARGMAEEYLQTLERLRGLVADAAYVVPGHGETLSAGRALEILQRDAEYVRSLRERGAAAPLPRAARSAAQRQRHNENVAAL